MILKYLKLGRLLYEEYKRVGSGGGPPIPWCDLPFPVRQEWVADAARFEAHAAELGLGIVELTTGKKDSDEKT